MANFKADTQEESDRRSEHDPTDEFVRSRAFRHSTSRQKLTFVPAATQDDVNLDHRISSVDMADLYKRIVLHSRKDSSGSPGVPPLARRPDTLQVTASNHFHSESEQGNPSQLAPGKEQISATANETSLAYQAGLEHSFPPSHLDRNGKGFKYLEAYGWNADERCGLGPSGEGVRAPLKGVTKYNTAGLGLETPEPSKRKQTTEPRSLDAGKVRKQYAQDRKRTERLREMFYGDGKVERYLGQSGVP